GVARTLFLLAQTEPRLAAMLPASRVAYSPVPRPTSRHASPSRLLEAEVAHPAADAVLRHPGAFGNLGLQEPLVMVARPQPGSIPIGWGAIGEQLTAEPADDSMATR